MKRFLFAAALLAVWTNLGFAQTKEIQDQLDKQLKELRTEDELLRQALASHPDVMVAQAKRQVAEAELAQVKLAMAQKFSKLKSEMAIEEATHRAARIALDRLMEMRKKGVVNDQEVLNAEAKVQSSQAKLALLNSELKEAMPAEKKSSTTHPDVMVATAKLQVADAELAQAKLIISQKVATLKSEIESQKQKLTMYESAYSDLQKAHQAGTAPKAEVMPAQIRFLESRSSLSRLRLELKNYTDMRQDPDAAKTPTNLFLGNEWNGLGGGPIGAEFHLKLADATHRPTGSAAEKLNAVLDTKVKFESKAQLASAIIRSLKEKYGLDLVIRMPLLEKDGGFPIERITISVNPGDMTFTTWLELIIDDLNSKMNQEDMKFVVYVREYGLLITPEKLVPRDAVTLKEFARLVRAEKAKEKAATEAKQP